MAQCGISRTTAVIVLAVISLAYVAASKTTVPGCASSCKGRKGLIISCNSCKAYFNCWHGHEPEQKCPSGLFFNPTYKVCIRKNKIKCRVQDSSFDQIIVAPPIDGQYGDFGQWSECDKSCGGGVSFRTRSCDDPPPMNGGKNCQGESEERRVCNQHVCPDCSRTCPNGGVLVDCTYCACVGSVVKGRVLIENSNIPQADVDVFDIFREWAPISKTGKLGEFEITDVCVDNLLLKFIKQGFYSELDRYTARYSDPLTIRMFDLKSVVFEIEPSDTAAFVGQKVTFKCKADISTSGISYEWFKGGVKVYTDVTTTTSGVSEYSLTTVSASDAGLYGCRVRADNGDKFSKFATLVVSNVTSGSRRRRRRDTGMVDTCVEKPVKDVNMHTLPAHCSVKIGRKRKNVVDLGACSNSACQFTEGGADGSYGCGVVSTSVLKVTCSGGLSDYSFEIPVAKECGCIKQTSGNTVGIKGIIQTAEGIGLPEVDIMVADQRFKVHSGNKFYFEAVPVNGVVVFHVIPSSSYLSRVVAIDVSGRGVQEVFTVVKLTSTPAVNVIQADKTQKLRVKSASGKHAAAVYISANSMINKRGVLVSGKVEAYVTFDDATVQGGLETAPGQFIETDNNGMPSLLKPHGVISIFLKQNGEHIYTQGIVRFKIYTKNLGIPKQSGNEWVSKARLYTFDKYSGQWSRASDITYRLNRQPFAYSEAEFPAQYPIIAAVQQYLPKRRTCQVSVQVYQDAAFLAPLSGEIVAVTTLDGSTSAVVGHSTAITDRGGHACLSVPCDSGHRLTVGSADTDVVVTSEKHVLPAGYVFRNQGNHVTFKSTKLQEFRDLDGPVHPYSTQTCNSKSKYGFKFAILTPRPLTLGKLFPVVPVSQQDMSWYDEQTDSEDRRVCMVRLDIMTTDAAGTSVTSESFSEPEMEATPASYYGLFISRLEKSLNPYSFDVVKNNFRTCVQVRCPTEGHTTTSRFTINSSTKCSYRLSYAESTELISSTDGSLEMSLRHNSFSKDSRGFYSATGTGNSAYREVLDKCIASAAYSALFDCSDNSVKHMGWG